MKATLILISLFFQMGAFAITCQTPRGAKVLDIKSQSVAIKQPFRIDSTRAVASLNKVRTKILGNGFTKVLFHKGEKHIIHVSDKENFSNLDDYLIVRSAEGHEMTYPLECED
ncbi:MAG: hypothetical protein VXV96_15080 [Bdellovibrionota bacterium]|jgi:hypothetical protein|nr:hypothetical protein [Bdellovibrionota bacterium]